MKRLYSALAVVALSAGQIFAASFVVPPDREFVRQAPAIALGSALESHTQLNDKGGIETITTFSIEEAIKGSFDADTIDIFEPGGVYKDRATMFPGTPRFRDGERYLLFLMKSDDGHWHVLDLVLGKFHFATDMLGRDVVLRDMRDALALEPGGGPRRESNRAAEPFLNFIRVTVNGGPAREDYLIPAEPLLGTPTPAPRNGANGHLKPATQAFSATSYTFALDQTTTGTGGRWCGTIVAGSCAVAFPSAVTFRSIGSEPGAPGSPAGSTAITTAFSAWNGAPGASVNYSYGGNDSSGTTNAPNAAGDGKNTIAFEYNLSTCCGIAAFSCNSMGYSGTLGLGGISATSGTHTGPNGETFDTTIEGDVWMNQGIANCTLLIGPGDFNSAVTHEVGHTLGFRHADQDRDDASACPGTIECSSNAIMKSFISQGLNATLQTYDIHAVAAVYPAPAAPAAPTGVVATATTATNVQVSWSGSCVTTCHVYRSADHINYSLAGSSATSPFNDSTAAANTAYLYKVRAFNGSTESADSNTDLATTVIYTDDSLVAGSTIVKSVHLTEIRTAVNAVRALAGLAAATFTNSGSAGTVVAAVDINELRTDLDQAAPTVGLPTGGYTDSPLVAGSTIIKAVHFQELRNRMK